MHTKIGSYSASFLIKLMGFFCPFDIISLTASVIKKSLKKCLNYLLFLSQYVNPHNRHTPFFYCTFPANANLFAVLILKFNILLGEIILKKYDMVLSYIFL